MKIGFIGCGNMAGAIIGGLLDSGAYHKEDIIGADVYAPSREKTAKNFGIKVTDQNLEVVSLADIVVLSVKPQFVEDVIKDIRDHVREDQLFITIIPGKTLAWLNETFGKEMKIIRTMPNTPALVKEGMTGVCAGDKVTEEDLKKGMEILNAFGRTVAIKEELLDILTGVSGCGPAYCFLFIEALADAGVVGGLSRSQAYELAAQTLLGSAKLFLESGKHPGELKDMVCSPGGATIEGVRTLENMGFRSAVMEAVLASADKSRSL